MPSASPSSRRNTTLAMNLVALTLGMLMLAYASVPLYRLFCETTGFGGATKRAIAAPLPGAREITVSFNADTDPHLPWQFTPDQKSVRVRVGEDTLVSYSARNKADKPVTGHAVYNVVPHKAGAYFAKIECFCFKNQTLEAGGKVHMPVSFFIDPAIASDPSMDGIDEITLSYTFFPATSSGTP